MQSKMWEDLKMYCSSKHEVDTAVRILRGCSPRLERMDNEPRFVAEVAGAALTCLRAFSGATSKALQGAKPETWLVIYPPYDASMPGSLLFTAVEYVIGSQVTDCQSISRCGAR